MSRPINPLNVGPETEDFLAKAELFFASDSLSAVAIANRLKTDRTSVALNFAAELGVPANNADVRKVEEVCDRFVGYLNAARSKKFAKADGAFSVTTL